MSENKKIEESPPGPEETASSVAPRGSEAKRNPKVVFYMLLPVILLLTSVIGWIVMMSIAVDDPGFALEPDYYKKASNFEDQVTQRRINERLGWKLKIVEFVRVDVDDARLVVSLKDGDGFPLGDARISVDAFANARASRMKQLVLAPRAEQPGVYEGHLERVRPGLWEARMSVERGADRFTLTLRPELGVATVPE